jgi:acetyl-CoA carboxylase carboxyl transferase subunit beta
MRGGRKADTPSDLWVKDPDSGEMIFRAELEKSLWVTPSGRHMRINPAQRFKVTFDDGAHETLPLPTVPEDPLGFADDRPYTERLKTARDATGEPDAMAIGYGAIRGVPAVALVQDFSFMGGSLGMAAGEAFIAAARAAVERDAPMVCFTASGGARMQEGTLSLMQMARSTLAIQELKAARLPYVVVQTDPTTGGVLASYAMLGRRPPRRARRHARLLRPPRNRADHPRDTAARSSKPASSSKHAAWSTARRPPGPISRRCWARSSAS